jgi:thymidylate synthase
MVSDELSVPIGKYLHFAASLHVYEKHFDMLRSISMEKKK